MHQVKKGNKVKVFYTGKHKDGTIFETNVGHSPLEFIVGKGKVIKGFENAVIGMKLGEVKTVTFKPAEAYGAKDPALIYTLPISDLPSGVSIGADVSFTQTDGIIAEGRISKIDGDLVTVDCNHPLSGRNLTFEIKLAGLG